jgi:hypothetical protein
MMADFVKVAIRTLVAAKGITLPRSSVASARGSSLGREAELLSWREADDDRLD